MTLQRQMARIFILFLAGLLIGSCSAVKQLTNVQKPNVSIKNVRFTGMSLSDIDLAVEVGIENPNQMGVNLQAFDYDFQINDASFLAGQQEKPQQIEANGSSSFEIPLTLNFKDLYSTFTSLKNQDNSGYNIGAGLTFDLPILGKTRIPISKSGEFPLIKLPTVKFAGIKVDKINLTGADMALNIEVNNPNAFGFTLKDLNYNFNVNGKNWAQGISQSLTEISEKGTGTVKIPISLNFLEIGTAVFSMLSNSSNVDYSFDGNFGFDSALPLLKNMNVPINRSGKLDIIR